MTRYFWVTTDRGDVLVPIAETQEEVNRIESDCFDRHWDCKEITAKRFAELEEIVRMSVN